MSHGPHDQTHAVARHPLHESLGALVGHEHVLGTEEIGAAYRHDRSPFPDVEPGVVVRPGSVDEVSRVVRLAHEHGWPVVPYGGGFSHAGFTMTPPRTSVVVDMRRLNRVLEVDEENMTVTAEAGILMSDLEAAVQAKGFQVHTVSVPVRWTTLGGVLSGVVGGGLPADGAAVGDGVRFLLGLTVVLADGSVVSTNAGGSNVHRS